ncbi:MAG TPA: SEL1-like repeat protein, partial [bacterium]|nr:SEL1-like repeat protein [bacterium]
MLRQFFFAAIILAAAPLASAGLDDAKAAYESGRYADAVQLLMAAAKQGDAKAECGLGVMYEHGRGVPQDLGHAMEWYLKAAAQG